MLHNSHMGLEVNMSLSDKRRGRLDDNMEVLEWLYPEEDVKASIKKRL